MSLRDQAAELEALAAQKVIDAMRAAGVDPDHVIAWTVHADGYSDDRDPQGVLRPWPASMTRTDVLEMVALEQARRVFEQHAQEQRT